MLSILIPIYNQDVRPLVFTLLKQCTKLNINYQILCFDDGSTPEFKEKNKELAFIFGVNYTEMTENLGRSRIRNWLGKAAYYPYLLYLDGDTKIKNKDFIKTYMAFLPAEAVIYGGRNYTKRRPTNTKKLLHWKYGTFVESRSAKFRNKDSYLHFMSNNFIVPHKVFENCPFDENTSGYGFEDLQYAKRLQNLNVPVIHINNPTEHGGIENFDVFLKKTLQSLTNLIMLENKKEIPVTRLIKVYKFLCDLHFMKIFMKISRRAEGWLYRNLCGKNPYIWVFQWWKLYQYCTKRAE